MWSAPAGKRQIVGRSVAAHTHSSRRTTLLSIGSVLLACTGPARAADQTDASSPNVGQLEAFSDNIAQLEAEAAEAYANRDFRKAVDKLSELIYQQPTSPRWSEMRAQVLVDGKNFAAAVMDYNEAIQRTPGNDAIARARLLAGRGLALEGDGDYKNALLDYQTAQQLASSAKASADPYVLNSIGNCHASLGEWPEAREAYSTAARVFQASSGFRGRGGSTTQRVDGAIFAQANAALARAQLGDLAGARKELEYVARRGPGSVDARAALAALYYHEGRQSAAEGQWEFACDSISVGCGKYRSREWLEGVRRWPPVMVELLGEFLELRRGEGAAQR